MMNLSICIPTYNRASLLLNCLHSIKSMRRPLDFKFEVCISDNGSNDNTREIVSSARTDLNINYNKNNVNVGIPRNFMKVVSMAIGEFVWLIGDDDLLLPHTLETLDVLFKKKTVDFFFINSYLLDTNYIFSFPQPFDISNIPEKMNKFSSYTKSKKVEFFELINPKISFDFLGGMYLSVFKRKMWLNNVSILNKDAINDLRVFSHFDNTFPHVKIFSAAFANSYAYINAEPLSICLSGAREWAPMNPLVTSIRIVEALEEYRKNGLRLTQYIYCKNSALSNFLPHILKMYMNKKESGFYYLDLKKHILKNMIFPNFYFSLINYFIKKFISQITKIIKK